jgi:hypothetical protein
MFNHWEAKKYIMTHLDDTTFEKDKLSVPEWSEDTAKSVVTI